MDNLLNIDFTNMNEKNFQGYDSVKQMMTPEHQQLLDKVNEGIEYIKENQHTFGCGAECKKNSKEESLYNQFLQAKTSLDNAPNKLIDAERNYITFKEGGVAYQELIEKQQNEKAKQNILEIKNQFNNKKDKIKIMIDAFEDQTIYDKNINELDNIYSEQISILTKKQIKKENKQAMDNRLSYYNLEWLSPIQYINYLLKYLFWLLVIIYLVLSIFYKRYNRTHFKIGVPIMLLFGFVSFNSWYIPFINFIQKYI